MRAAKNDFFANYGHNMPIRTPPAHDFSAYEEKMISKGYSIEKKPYTGLYRTTDFIRLSCNNTFTFHYIALLFLS